MFLHLRYSTDSLKTYIAVILFFPTLWGFLGEHGISLGQILYTFSVLGIGFTLLLYRRTQPKIPSIYTRLFAVQTFIYAISLSVNSFIRNGNVTMSDMTDLYRPISYILSITIGYSLYDKSVMIERVIRFTICTIILCSLLDCLKFTPIGVNALKLYTHLAPGSFNYMRFSGTFAYCYNYVYVLIFGLLLSLFCNIRRPLSFAVFSGLIILGGSRAGFAAFAFAILLYYLMNKRFSSAIFSISLTVVSASVVIYLLTFLDIPLLNDIFANVEKLSAALSGDGVDGSMNTRNSQLDTALTNFYESPLWGRGPLKGSTKPIEIQMGYYISSWGMAGTSVYLAIIGSFLYFAWKMRKRRGIIGRFSKANFAWILCSFIIGLSTPITDQIRVSQLFFLVQGIQYGLYFMEKHNLNPKSIKKNTDD